MRLPTALPDIRRTGALIVAAVLAATPVSAHQGAGDAGSRQAPAIGLDLDMPDADGQASDNEAFASSPAADVPAGRNGIAWHAVIGESLMFLTVEHSLRMTSERTRSQLDGPFVKDWFDSVASMDRFNDNGKFLTNFIAHPMQGSVSAFILGQNDPVYASASVGDKQYWKAKRRQLIFATVYSTQFELGPLSESSLGNIHQGCIDLLVTPTLGTLWSVGEDLAAQHVLKPLRPNHPKWANTLAIFLNPTRSLANVFAFKAPWTCDVRSCQ